MYVDRRGNSNAKRAGREVTLRSEQMDDGSKLNLWAYLDTKGCLHIDAQDLGPITEPISGDGEYEYFLTIDNKDIPKLIQLLGGKAGDDVLRLLDRYWAGDKSYELEDLLRNCEIKVGFDAWSG